MEKVILIDGNSLVFRAYYATSYTGNVMSTSFGMPTNAIYALANMLKSLVSKNKFDYCLVAFDTHKPTFRHLKYEGYKKGRKETPKELLVQFPLAKELIKLFGFVPYEMEGYEADDIVGSLAKKFAKEGKSVDIYSGDKDLLQLIDDNVTVYLTRKGLSETSKMDKEGLREFWGILPTQVTDLKGLMGDPSDNIKGIAGIGEKTAVKLLNEYGSLENILEAPLKGKLKEKIDLGRNDGLESKELATIYVDIDFPFDLETLRVKDIDNNGLRDFYLKYEMKSLLSRLTVKTNEVNEVNVEFISKLPKIDGLSSFEVVLTDDNPFVGKIKGYLVSEKEHNYYLSYEDSLIDQGFLSYLKNNPKVTFDSKKVYASLMYKHIEINDFLFDLNLATYLLDSKSSLEERLVFEYYGKEYEDISKLRKKIKEYNNETILPLINNLAIKNKMVLDIYPASDKSLKDNDLTYLFYDVELPLSKVLAKMEVNGVYVDRKELDSQKEIVLAKVENLEKEIKVYLGDNINLKSPTQLASALFDDLKLKANKKRSTSAQELENLVDDHPVIGLILEHRKYQKLLSNYLIGIQDYIYEDNKCHSIFTQTLTQTGRLSSKEPNLQNISVKDSDSKLVRKAFKPLDKGHYYLSIDYSQIELRVLAHLANAKTMIDAFNQDIDIHSHTASLIFNKDVKDVSDLERRMAKATNFGIVYGISDFGLSEQLKISIIEAREIINDYYARFYEIKDYLNSLVEYCKTHGYVKTLLGRTRFVEEMQDASYMKREFAKRVAMNTPIQGSASDIIKLAMLECDKLLEENNYQTKMILQIHDELIFDIPEEELMLVLPLLVEKMENVLDLKVKLKVDFAYGPSLYEC